MQRVVLSAVVLGLFTACGPSMEADHVKTPDELIADEIAKGDEQLKNQKNSSDYDDTSAGTTDEDKRRGWDAKQSDIELHRASHSAESCPQSIEEQDPKAKGKAKPPALGKATLAITFANDGHVKDATISPYEADSPLGKCVLRAMKAIIVPSYEGSEQVVNWEIDLSGGKKSGPVGGEAPSDEKK
ncbi:MAG TPA: hypothetical protein VHP33_15545 [Polyangiaceae bacterium]|nr:hypothetical protein [Polyangiaceae bacterium]